MFVFETVLCPCLRLSVFETVWCPCLVAVYGKARVCTYNAGYYCYECHENDEYYIPSRIIHNWDFRKHQGGL